MPTCLRESTGKIKAEGFFKAEAISSSKKTTKEPFWSYWSEALQYATISTKTLFTFAVN